MFGIYLHSPVTWRCNVCDSHIKSEISVNNSPFHDGLYLHHPDAVAVEFEFYYAVILIVACKVVF